MTELMTAEQLSHDHRALRREIYRLDEALEALELRGELAGLAAFLLQFTGWCHEHFEREEHALADNPGSLAGLAVERRLVEQQIDQLRSHLHRTTGQSDRDQLWVEAQRFRAALSCHFCREERSCTDPYEYMGSGSGIR